MGNGMSFAMQPTGFPACIGNGIFNGALPNPAIRSRTPLSILKGVRDLIAGFGKAPLNIPLPMQAGNPVGCMAKLMPLPIADQYAVVTQLLTEKQFYEMTLKNFYEFIRIDLSKPIHQFAQQLGLLADEKLPSEVQRLVESGNTISERLQRIEMLAELFGTSPLVDQERLLFESMITEALNAERRQLESRGLEVYLEGLG